MSMNTSAEAQLRGAADQAWSAVWLIEWASDSGDAVHDALQALAQGLALLHSQGGRYRLLTEMNS